MKKSACALLQMLWRPEQVVGHFQVKRTSVFDLCWLPPCGRLNNGPQNIHLLILRTREYQETLQKACCISEWAKDL